MGGCGGPMWQRITYHLPTPSPPGSDQALPSQHGKVTIEDARGTITSSEEFASFWDFLEMQMQLYKTQAPSCNALPFDFCGGLVGYLGYELKAETCGDNTFQSPYPDASLWVVDRYAFHAI